MSNRHTKLNCQLACLEGMKEVFGTKFVDPRDYKGQRSNDSGGRYFSFKSVKQQSIPKNVLVYTTIPYLMWTYDVSKCAFKIKRHLKEQKMAITIADSIPKKHTGQSVIDCRELACER